MGGGGCPKEASVTGVGFAYQISILTCYGGGGGVPGMWVHFVFEF